MDPDKIIVPDDLPCRHERRIPLGLLLRGFFSVLSVPLHRQVRGGVVGGVVRRGAEAYHRTRP